MYFSKAALLSNVLLCTGVFGGVVEVEERGGKKPWVSSKALQRDITQKNLMANLKTLDTIAKENGNNRAFGYPGFTKSVEYIKSQLAKHKKTANFWTQDFPALFAKVESISLVVDGVSYYVFGLTYSPSTDADGITAPLVLGPTGAAGCTVEGYAGYDITDKIVLVERGTCPTGGTLAGRVRPAAAAGAASVIIYNNVDTNVTAGTLSAPDPDHFVPAGFINRVDGLALVAKLGNGTSLEATFQQTQTVETKITQNVFAETKEGDPNNVIMLGAHLDSVPAGPGINDDGSGTSLILENFEALQNYRHKNKVRFAWWGAEELGLVGSRYYIKTLNSTSVNQLLLYLNFDMVSRGYFGVFDGDGSTHGVRGAAGSDVIEKLFVDDLTSKGINVTAAAFTNGSDYAGFMDTLFKPIGGLHTGTGAAQDPCYHQACDTYENANATVLTVNAKTTAHVLAILAQKGHELIPRNATTVTRDARIGQIDLDFQWTHLEGERHTQLTCGAED